jgi:hypothetical protein
VSEGLEGAFTSSTDGSRHDPARHALVAALATTAAAFGLTSATAQAAGTRAGATRAAKRHLVTYVKRYGIVLHTSELDLQCSSVGRSRWKCFVYANGGECTGTLTEAYSTRVRVYRARNINIGFGE